MLEKGKVHLTASTAQDPGVGKAGGRGRARAVRQRRARCRGPDSRRNSGCLWNGKEASAAAAQGARRRTGRRGQRSRPGSPRKGFDCSSGRWDEGPSAEGRRDSVCASKSHSGCHVVNASAETRAEAGASVGAPAIVRGPDGGGWTREVAMETEARTRLRVTRGKAGRRPVFSVPPPHTLTQTGWETPSTAFLQKKPGSAWRLCSLHRIMSRR